ncbi:MAG: hypothetical protein J6M39_05860 [Lachnospiraceae bacterium]|nr:hypothetical protein [Lachnospiraceae bacterium]
MQAKIVKKYLYIVSMLVLCFSCTKEKRSEIIKNEVTKNKSYIETNSTNANVEESRFIINKRTGKIHSYTHGIKVVSDKYQLESNEDIEKLLENENYDICLNCYAGLKLNLDKYKTSDRNISNDEVDISNHEVNLIKHYMNMYEFGKLDTETQKFLICIFEVGNWYVNNVYTQLGGQKTAREVDDIAEVEASEAAYNKWRNYLTLYGNQYKFNENKKILPVIYDNKHKKYSEMVTYRCDLFKDAGYGKGDNRYSQSGQVTLKNAEGEEIDKEWKNYCVVDDSSKFAAAIYYHYINKDILKNKEQDKRIAYGIDLWGTRTTDYLLPNSSILNKLIKISRKFALFSEIDILEENKKYERKETNEKFSLAVGDLICKHQEKNVAGNVEFYIGNNKYVGWGHINKSYTIKKKLTMTNNKFYSDYEGDKGTPYTTVIRFKGD